MLFFAWFVGGFFQFLIPMPFLFLEQVSINIGAYLEIPLSVYSLFQIIYAHVAQKKAKQRQFLDSISEMPLLKKQTKYAFTNFSFFFFLLLA